MWNPVLLTLTAMKRTDKKEDFQMSMVKIRLPKAREGQEQEIFVGVNGTGYRIRKGVEVSVPAAVAEVLRHAEEAADTNDRFLQSAADPQAQM